MKYFLNILVIVILAVVVYAATFSVELEGIENNGEGLAKISSIKDRDNPRGQIRLYIDNLPVLEEDEVYEGWLVDTDTNYKLSLGIFTVKRSGKAYLTFKTENYFDEYDSIVVTKEPFPDDNPGPSGEVVLIGDLE